MELMISSLGAFKNASGEVYFSNKVIAVFVVILEKIFTKYGTGLPKLDLVKSDGSIVETYNPEIFENTIRYNITLGLPVEDMEITQVCETASFREVLDQLPNKLESSIKEKGVNLSGGQKQRLALARGILAARTSDIILMDEPTSSVDPRTELIIYQRLFDLFKEKVMVSALHRLHLLVHFDYVYVMKDGRIVEEGNFEELRKNGWVFRELWKHQETIASQGD